MKKLLLYAFLLLMSSNAWSQSLTITESAGWLESAFVKWQSVAGAESYNVYYSGVGLIDKKIDTELIRSYGTYYRADILGLKAGSYTIKVVAVIAGLEAVSSTTETLTVLAQDRSGFAFSNGRIPGAYKADGTTKDGAVILYISQNTKNSISLNVTSANANPCVGLQTILDGFKKGKDLRPLIVRIIGQITDLSYMLGGDIVIENDNNAASYITFEGVGDDAVADGWGIRIKNASNIEVRNIGTMNCNSDEGDNIGLQQANDYIWVHNCDLFYGDAGGDADQIKGDGALDCKKSTNVTFSYNHFWDSGKCNLLGLSEGASNDLLITYHHNWYDHSDSRHPRVRYYSAHVYNNYYDGNAKYGAGSTLGSSVFMEANYFRNCKYPMLTSMQGSDVWDGSKNTNDYKNMPTFSSEDGGTIKAFNNYMTGQSRFVAYGATGYLISTNIDFDAYVVENRNDQVPNTVKSVYGANTYNNFDTNSAVMYAYTPHSPEAAKTIVMLYAGRLNGGDFKWTFDNAVDDAAYAVNTALKAALISYKTKLVSVQGEYNSTLNCTSNNKDQSVSTGNAINTITIVWGGDATDATVTGLPASGISFVKDAGNKTISISGTPTATTSYTITSIAASGNPATITGTITVGNNGEGGETTTVAMSHNFTVSGSTSTFYNITGNLSTSKGTVSYNDLTLTQCLKIESATSITFTTSQTASLTLVFNPDFSGKIYVNAIAYNAVAGIVTITLPAGSNTITKGDSANLFYMSVVYNTTGFNKTTLNTINLYPNPVLNNLCIVSDIELSKIEIYTCNGVLLKSAGANVKTIDLSNLKTGTYLLRLTTEQGILNKTIVKK